MLLLKRMMPIFLNSMWVNLVSSSFGIAERKDSNFLSYPEKKFEKKLVRMTNVCK
jgi:hypothetical protein